MVATTIEIFYGIPLTLTGIIQLIHKLGITITDLSLNTNPKMDLDDETIWNELSSYDEIFNDAKEKWRTSGRKKAPDFYSITLQKLMKKYSLSQKEIEHINQIWDDQKYETFETIRKKLQEKNIQTTNWRCCLKKPGQEMFIGASLLNVSMEDGGEIDAMELVSLLTNVDEDVSTFLQENYPDEKPSVFFVPDDCYSCS